MRVRVASEFQRPLPKEASKAIETFNGQLEHDPEAVRRALARKVFAKHSENPELDFAIQSLVDAKQPTEQPLETEGQPPVPPERPLALGFTPAEFTWGEIWREKNYADARAQQTARENDIKALEGVPVQNNDILRAQSLSILDLTSELAEIRRRRRIIALGTAAFINTPRYEGPKAPLNFIDPNDLVDRHVKAA